MRSYVRVRVDFISEDSPPDLLKKLMALADSYRECATRITLTSKEPGKKEVKEAEFIGGKPFGIDEWEKIK